ncbi:hypothetical protein LIER_04862 [Lithospermum erythrorhizon]|uniref:Reverse transcriptase n=1 Tax=Lithospermum erythrorhizon TaxID=34254 RepID=A0AAV3NYK0_LITER
MLSVAEERKMLTATHEDWANVVDILRDYEEASGQKINFGKCSVSFEKRTSLEVLHRVGALLHINEVPNQGKYLGLPSHIGKSKKEVFGFIHGRVDDKIKGWKGKLLSQAGREVMLKSITSSIQNYVMN